MTKEKEDEVREQTKEQSQREAIFHRVIRVERNGVLLTFHRNPDRIIIAGYVQCPNVQHNHTGNQERNQIMQQM